MSAKFADFDNAETIEAPSSIAQFRRSETGQLRASARRQVALDRR